MLVLLLFVISFDMLFADFMCLKYMCHKFLVATCRFLRMVNPAYFNSMLYSVKKAVSEEWA